MMFSEIVDYKPDDCIPVNSYRRHTFRNLYYSPRKNAYYQYNGYVYTIHKVFSYDKRGPVAHVRDTSGQWTTVPPPI